MIDLEKALVTEASLSLSNEWNSLISQAMGRIFELSNGENEAFRSSFGEKSMEEVRLNIHRSGIIENYLFKSFFANFSKPYFEFCYENSLMKDHVSPAWDLHYSESFAEAKRILSDPARHSSGRWSRWSRLDRKKYNALICSTREDSGIVWSDVFNDRFKNRKVEYIGEIETFIIRISAKSATSHVVKLVEDTEFSKNYSAAIRSAIYKSLIQSKSLTKKVARRIRSDQSEGTSLESISMMVEFYKESPIFPELLSQVVDTNYSTVARYLAERLDTKHLTFMAGTRHTFARETVAKRMMDNSGR
jgi:hypothetical protein